MYVYNLTMVVGDGVFSEWQEWLKSSYLPRVKAIEGVENVRVFKLLDVPEKHYAVHCEISSPMLLLRFMTDIVPELLQEAAGLFGEEVLFWGTQLKEMIND
nr:DUF4286 family protein [uncultured Capnocytophaga sp.]